MADRWAWLRAVASSLDGCGTSDTGRALAGVACAVAARQRVRLPELRLLSAWGRPLPVAIPDGVAADAWLLGEALEALLRGDDRRRRGVHHTPAPVARTVAALAMDGGPTALATVCDPAVGGGVFLLAAAELLAAGGMAPGRVVRHLTGIDVDPLAVAVTEAALCVWAGGRRGCDLVVGDALALPAAAWGAPGVVVGNPPFLGQLRTATVRSADRGTLRPEAAAVAGPYTDTSALFAALAVARVAPAGRVAMVLPRSFLVARDAGPAREATLAAADLAHVWLPGPRLFDAAVDVCVPVWQRRPSVRAGDAVSDGARSRAAGAVRERASDGSERGADGRSPDGPSVWCAIGPRRPPPATAGASQRGDDGGSAGGPLAAWADGPGPAPAGDVPAVVRSPVGELERDGDGRSSSSPQGEIARGPGPGLVSRSTGMPPSPARPCSAPSPGRAPWSQVLADLRPGPAVPSLAGLRSNGVLGDRCTVTAGFRDQYYGLIPFVLDDAQGAYDDATHAPLVTSGLIDHACSRWGERPTRYAGRRWCAPRVDLHAVEVAGGALARWVPGKRVPKVLVAAQTRTIEAVVDVDGTWLPSTPVATLVPDAGLHWHVLAVLLSPVATAWALLHHPDGGMRSGALRLPPSALRALPVPAGGQAWGVAAATVEAASGVSAEGERRRLLATAAGSMCDAYGVDPGATAAWWAGQLPAP